MVLGLSCFAVCLPDPGIEPMSPALAGGFFTIEPSGKAKVKVAQSCLTLCNPMDYTVHEILQGRTVEWVAIAFFENLLHDVKQKWQE